MGFLDFIKSFLSPDQQTIYVTQRALIGQESKLSIEMFAITSAINMVASAISKCEFKTYIKGVEEKADEYYSWNVEPNKNQNSSQFIQEFVSKLLYYNECLVMDFAGQLVIADGFYQNEFATVENYFTGVWRGTMKFDRTFKMSEVLYFKLGSDDIRNLLSGLLKGYSDLLNMGISKYKRSGGRKGILDINATATGDKNFQTKFDDLMNNRFKSYFEAENAVLPLHNGYKYEEQGGEGSKKSTSEIVDIAAITKESFDRVAQAFKIPPSLLRGDIADVGNLTDNFLTFCIDPIVEMLDEEIIRKRYGKAALLADTYLRIDTTAIKHIDLFGISTSFDKLIASGGYSIDELRIKAGDVPLNTDFSEKHWMTKNYQDVETAGQAVEGGGNI